jgi:uncharacterized protein GlcG (DUF336 family)
MNIQERVSALFSKYSAMLSEEKVALATATLEGGQIIQTEAEEWAVGVPVFVVNDEGEQIPLPDGDYTLEDGTTFTVAEGAVAAWTAAAVEVEDAKEEEKMSEVLTREEVQNMIADALNNINAQLSAVTKAIEEKEAKIEKLAKSSTPKVPKAPVQKQSTPLNLSNLSEAERVRILMTNSIF